MWRTVEGPAASAHAAGRPGPAAHHSEASRTRRNSPERSLLSGQKKAGLPRCNRSSQKHRVCRNRTPGDAKCWAAASESGQCGRCWLERRARPGGAPSAEDSTGCGGGDRSEGGEVRTSNERNKMKRPAAVKRARAVKRVRDSFPSTGPQAGGVRGAETAAAGRLAGWPWAGRAGDAGARRLGPRGGRGRRRRGRGGTGGRGYEEG